MAKHITKGPAYYCNARHEAARAFAFVFLRHLPFLSVPSPGTCTCARTGTCSEMRRLSASILAAVQWSLMTRVVRCRACQQGAFPRHEGASCPAYKPVPKRQNSRDDIARPNITSVRSSARLHQPSRCVPEGANTADSPSVWLA